MKPDYSKIHPELKQVAKRFPQITYNKNTLWLFYVLLALMPKPKPPQDVDIENIFIPSQNDKQKIRLRIYKPKPTTPSMPVLLWMHGGGYVIGKPEQDDASCVHYVRELGITVISIDYRLAPKYPFPAGLEDCYSALQWISANAEKLGIDNKRIAVGGGSAGAGLAASLAQFAHDQNEIKPIFQLLLYPMLDDRTVLRTELDDSNGITWNQKSNRFGWESYLGKECGAENTPEYAVPARRENLTGLPNTWIGVGTLDLFCEENLAYAQRLKESGVACETHIVSGAFHGFDVFDAQIPVVQEFRKSQITALKKCFFG